MKLLPMLFTLYLFLTNQVQAISVNPEQALKTVEGNLQGIILASSGIAFLMVGAHYKFRDGKEGQEKLSKVMIGLFITVTSTGIFQYFFNR